jgi:RNA polymerase sigma-70 factor (ECF subfamily)
VIEDKELIERIRQGDQKAFRMVYDMHYKLMLGVAINLTRDVDSAKEIVQEVFYQFWKNHDAVKDGIAIRNYLKRAVINRSINYHKYNARFTGDEVLQHAPSAFINSDTQIEANELQTEIQRAMDKLPEKARVIFVLKRHEGLSLNEIADQLGISPKTVENQITRALKILKDELEPYLKNMNSV